MYTAPILVRSALPPTSSTTPAAAALLQPTLPSASAQRQIAEARAALVASLGNMVDSELQGRASELHANAAALARQERDVARATAALRRDVDQLAREAAVATRHVKELGSVQNWAEVLHRDFLLLNHTYDLARARLDHPSDDDGDGDGSASDECGSQCSCGRSSDDGAVAVAASASAAGPARQPDEAFRDREDAVPSALEAEVEVEQAERAEQEDQEEGETILVDGDRGKGVAVDLQMAVDPQITAALPQMASMFFNE